MKAKAKGARRERQARDQLTAEGYAVTKAGGSLGIWDLVAVRRDPLGDDYLPVVRMIQVKSNRNPGRLETKVLRGDTARYMALFVRCEVWRYDDRKGKPSILILNPVDG